MAIGLTGVRETAVSAAPNPRRVALVGNAPGQSPAFARADGADWVVRFNNAPGFNGARGRRVTHLVLVNHGGQMREWLDDPGFTARPVVRAAANILFPFGEKADGGGDGDGADWTRAARERLEGSGARVTVIAQAVRDEAARLLRQGGAPSAAPSTGFLAALFVLAAAPGARVEAMGFGFAGWPGHGWGVERAWFERMDRDGRLRLHPAPEAS